MTRSLKIGQLFGIGIYIHWTFFLLPLWAVLNRGDSGVGVGFLLGLIGAIFGCVVLHELGHALTARYFGIGTRDITLFPIGGVARLERMSEKPWEEFWIAVGGPAVNVAIAVALVFLLIGLALVDTALVGNSPVGNFLFCLLAGNIIMILFNMVPAFPMDGGRVFRSVLSMWLGHLRATRIAATVGVFVALLLLVPLAWFTENVWLLIVVLFVLIAGQQELRYVEWKHQQDAEEPLPILPTGQFFPGRQEGVFAEGPRVNVPLSGFMYQPRVAVFVWDSENGAWVKESGPRVPPQ